MTVFQLALLACTTINSPWQWGGSTSCSPHNAGLYASKDSCEYDGQKQIGKVRHQFEAPSPTIADFRCAEVSVKP